MDGHVEVIEKSKVVEVGNPASGQITRYRLYLDTIPLGSGPGTGIYVPESMSSEEGSALVRSKFPSRNASHGK